MDISKKIERSRTYLELVKLQASELERYINQLEGRLKTVKNMELHNKAIANILDCSERTVTRMLNDGRLKSRMADEVIKYTNRR